MRLAAAFMILLGCSSSTSGVATPTPDAEIDSSATETSAPVDSALDDTSAPMDSMMPTDTPTSTTKAHVRIFHGLDAAEVYVCEDGARLGGTYSRVSSSGVFASGYIETTKFGSRRVRASASTAPACMPASSSDRSYSLAAGEAKTLFVRGLAGFNSVLPMADDLSAPPSGQARVRVFHGGIDFATTNGLIDVCTGGAAWATALPAAAAFPYQVTAPGTASIELRKTAMPACTGALLGTVSVTTAANATHTLFIVDGKPLGAQNHLSICTDARSGVPVTTFACTDTAF